MTADGVSDRGSQGTSGRSRSPKAITDAVNALDDVIEMKLEKGALHVSYDPLATIEKKMEQAIRSSGTTVKAATTDAETTHPAVRH